MGGAPARPPFRLLRSGDDRLERRRRHLRVSRRLRVFDDEGGFVTRQFVLLRHADERPLLQVRRRRARAGRARSSASTASRSTLRCSRPGICSTGSSGAAAVCRTSTCSIRRGASGAKAGERDTLFARRCSSSAVLGARRAGDVPGFEIPARYFQFVRSRRCAAARRRARAQPARFVVAGRPDGATAGSRPHRDPAPPDMRAKRWRSGACTRGAASGRAPRRVRVRYQLRRVWDGQLDRRGGASMAQRRLNGADQDRRAPVARAICPAGHVDIDEAAAYWRELLEIPGCPPHVVREASEALAIHHEHRARDLPAARAFALRSLTADAERHPTRACDQAVQHRLARLETEDGQVSGLPLKFEPVSVLEN